MTGMATERQVQFIRDLLDQKDLFKNPRFFDAVNAMDAGEYATYLDHLKNNVAPNTSKARASAWIEQLLSLPDKPREEEQPRQRDVRWDVANLANTGEEPMFAMLPSGGDGTVVVPRGSYAIDTRNGQNELMFISVWMNRDGTRWSVKRYESDTLVSMPRSQQYDILDRIAQDPVGAAERYGLEIGKCGICHRTLTNDISRARGIGPVCAERWGW
jgi:hypothetical protein